MSIFDNIDPVCLGAGIIAFALVVGYIHGKWSGSGGGSSGGCRTAKRSKKTSDSPKPKSRRHKR